LADKQAYLDRYAEPDKAGLGLDVEEGWPVPYWEIDTAFAVMAMLLAATDEGLGSLFFGIFRGEPELLQHLGVPPGLRPIGAIALGYPAALDHRSPSLARGRRPAATVVHWGAWGGRRDT
jgi:nitroreductase